MANKAFKGEVIESKDGSFTDSKTGELIVGWNISLMLTEEISKRFFISDRNVCYNEAKALVKGNVVVVHADGQPGFNDRMKWVPIQIEKIGATEKKEPPF